MGRGEGAVGGTSASRHVPRVTAVEVFLAGTRPPVVPPEERSPVGTTTVEVRTPAAAAGAGRRAPAGRSVPEEPASVVPRPATWSPVAGAGRPASAVRSGTEGSIPTVPQAEQSRHPRSVRGRTESGGGRRRGPAERRHHRTRARHRAGSKTDRQRASTRRERKYRWRDHLVSRKESEEVKVRVGGGWSGGGGVGKHRLIKHHMARDEDPTRGEVKAAVTLVVRGVPKKHTKGGTGC